MRAMHLSRVLLPEPLWPMRPYVVPSGHLERRRPARAQNSSYTVRRNPLKTVALSVQLRSWTRRNRLAHVVDGDGGIAHSELLGESGLEAAEHEAAEHEGAGEPTPRIAIHCVAAGHRRS